MLIREIIQAIAIKLGFIASPAMSPIFRSKHRKNNLIITIAVLIYLPFSHFLLGTSCLFQSTFGIPCPACGSTRSSYALIQGDVKKALYWHPLIFLSLAILIGTISIVLYDEVKKQRAYREGKEYKMRTLSSKFWFVFSGILVLYLIVYVIRFLDLYPNPPMNFNQKSILGRILNFIKKII